jgi:hypothetical protein
MIRKVIYIFEQPCSKWNYDRFGIEIFINKGWDIEIWDLSNVVYPSAVKNIATTISGGIKLDQLYVISNNQELEDRYKVLKGGEFYISAFGEGFYQLQVMRRLSEIGLMRIHQYLGFISVHEPKNKLSKSLARVVRFLNTTPSRSIKNLAFKILNKIYASQVCPRFLVVSGEKSIPHANSYKKADLIYAHNRDYDTFLRLSSCTQKVENEGIIFIDQNLCFHSDYALNSIPSAFVSINRYFPSLCRGLHTISQSLQERVKVAAHPRFNHENITNYFQGIAVEYGRTGELIQSSKVVVAHNSTAIQLAILFKKPLIFITTDELNNSEMRASIESVASELGKSVINIDGDISGVDWRNELSIDQFLYSEYRRKYIKKDGTPEIQAWDIVINDIEHSFLQKPEL